MDNQITFGRQFAQGDVYIIEASIIPSSIKLMPLSSDGLVVAIGESKGAKHTIVADRPALVEVGTDAQGFFWLKVGDGAGAKLVHQTHGAIELAPAWYRIGGQREADPLQEWRKVQD